jgi:hypothetical protein
MVSRFYILQQFGKLGWFTLTGDNFRSAVPFRSTLNGCPQCDCQRFCWENMRFQVKRFHLKYAFFTMGFGVQPSNQAYPGAELAAGSNRNGVFLRGDNTLW